MRPVGKHDAPEIGSGAGGGSEQTQEIPAVPEPEAGRRKPPARLLIGGAVALAVLLGGVVWAVGSSNESTVLVSGGPVGMPPAGVAWSAPVVVVTSSVPASPPSSPSPTRTAAVQAPTAGPAPTTTRPTASRGTSPTPPSNRLRATLAGTSWNGSYQGTYTITNPGTKPVSGWTLVVTFSGPGSIVQVWNAKATSGSSHRVTFTPMSYNDTVPAGGSVSFGFTVTGNPVPTPKSCTVNGNPC
jgi:Cellulose binding domain